MSIKLNLCDTHHICNVRISSILQQLLNGIQLALTSCKWQRRLTSWTTYCGISTTLQQQSDGCFLEFQKIFINTYASFDLLGIIKVHISGQSIWKNFFRFIRVPKGSGLQPKNCRASDLQDGQFGVLWLCIASLQGFLWPESTFLPRL